MCARLSRWPCRLRLTSVAARLLSSGVRIQLKALMYVSGVYVLGVQRNLRRADCSFRGFPPVVYMSNCVWSRDLDNEAPYKYARVRPLRPRKMKFHDLKLILFLFLNINQLDALNFVISLFQACTCFEHMCSSSGGQNCIIQPLVSSHL